MNSNLTLVLPRRDQVLALLAQRKASTSAVAPIPVDYPVCVAGPGG
jgi:hypothetical protein